MTEHTMTLPNGDVLHDGDWGRTRGGDLAHVRWAGNNSGIYPWAAGLAGYTMNGSYLLVGESFLDIVALAPSAPIPPVVSQELRDFSAMYHAANKAGLL